MYTCENNMENVVSKILNFKDINSSLFNLKDKYNDSILTYVCENKME